MRTRTPGSYLIMDYEAVVFPTEIAMLSTSVLNSRAHQLQAKPRTLPYPGSVKDAGPLSEWISPASAALQALLPSLTRRVRR